MDVNHTYKLNICCDAQLPAKQQMNEGFLEALAALKEKTKQLQIQFQRSGAMSQLWSSVPLRPGLACWVSMQIL